MIAHALANVRLRLSTASKGLLKVFGYAWPCQCLSHTSINKCNILCLFQQHNFFLMADKNKKPQAKKQAAAQSAAKVTTQKPAASSKGMLDALVEAGQSAVNKATEWLGLAGNQATTANKTQSAPKLSDYQGMLQPIPASEVMKHERFRLYRHAPIVAAAAEKYQINPYFLMALLQQESRLWEKLESPVKAKGVGQILPSTFFTEAFPKKDFPGEKPNIENPVHNIYSAANYIKSRRNANKVQDDIDALRAYNFGIGSITKSPEARYGVNNESRRFPLETIQRLNLIQTPYKDTVWLGPNNLPYPAVYGDRIAKEYEIAKQRGYDLDNRIKSGAIFQENESMLKYNKLMDPAKVKEIDKADIEKYSKLINQKIVDYAASPLYVEKQKKNQTAQTKRKK